MNHMVINDGIHLNGFVSARITLLILLLFLNHSVIAREEVEVSVKKIPAPAFRYLQVHHPEAKKIKYEGRDPKSANTELGPVNTYFAPATATDFVQHEA